MNETTNTSLKMGENTNAVKFFGGLKANNNVNTSGISRSDSNLVDAFEGLSTNLNNMSRIANENVT